MNKALAIAILSIGIASTASAQGVSDNATASATIVAPISIEKVTDMNFGNVSVGASSGTVLLSPIDASRTPADGVRLSAASPGSVSRASFSVAGEGSYTYAITLPSSALTLTRASGSETMTASSFTSSPSGTGALSSGTQTLYVGATLNVAGSQATGSYVSNNFPVSVVYN